MQISTAHLRTEKPQRLMTRLCRHWGHKFPVTLGEREGSIELPMGICRMRCSEVLTVELQADADQMARLQQVVADHLQRMASGETVVIEWQ